MTTRQSQKLNKTKFMDEAEIEEALRGMEQDIRLNTKQGPVNKAVHLVQDLSFFDRHMTYLKSHPKVNPEHYLSNLRTMIKKR